MLLNSGNAAKACTASSAIPPFFKSVTIDGRRLVDGAFSNSVPADVCRDMGAQFVVGIDLGAFVKPEEEKGMLARMLGSAINALVSVKYLEDSKTRGYDAADIMLKPNLYDYRATDVSLEAMNAMYDIGYNEVKSHIDEIKSALNKLGVEFNKKGKK